MIDYDDEFAGQGGSYVLNQDTGKRTLIERTQEQPETAAEQPADSQGE